MEVNKTMYGNNEGVQDKLLDICRKPFAHPRSSTMRKECAVF
jgi:hypothetical protein